MQAVLLAGNGLLLTRRAYSLSTVTSRSVFLLCSQNLYHSVRTILTVTYYYYSLPALLVLFCLNSVATIFVVDRPQGGLSPHLLIWLVRRIGANNKFFLFIYSLEAALASAFSAFLAAFCCCFNSFFCWFLVILPGSPPSAASPSPAPSAATGMTRSARGTLGLPFHFRGRTDMNSLTTSGVTLARRSWKAATYSCRYSMHTAFSYSPR